MPTTVEIFVERRPGGAGQPSEVDAFADLYNRTYNPLVAYCRRYCPPGYDPEDIAQEALAKAWSSWDRYSPSRPFWPWVATIARRLCVDYWRRDERAVARAGGVAALEPCPQPRPDELSEAADECRMALTAFRRLRPDHQRIVGLRDIEGWSYEDIARFEGVTVESIRGSLRRARLSLRKSYESVAKGGLPVFAPLAALVKSFEAARVRFSNRMARWQANLQDAGIASSRLGEALVSLMALSVAAVGVGAPGADVALRSDGAAAPAAAALAESADSAGDAADPGAGNGTSSTGTGGADVAPGTMHGSFGQTEWGVHKFNPLAPADPANATVYGIAVSPNYGTDGAVFAAAIKPGCAISCYTVLHRTQGSEWTDLQTVGLTSPRLLLPPSYPSDPRIFATGGVGLQLSVDGGRSFTTLLPSVGIGAMSPAFSAGDPHIFLPDAPGTRYNADTHLPVPLSLRPGPKGIAREYSFAFPARYDPANPVLYVAAVIQGESRGPAAIYRCVNWACGEPTYLPGLLRVPRLSVVPLPDGTEAVFAVQGTWLFRSLDGGRTYTKMTFPAGVGGSVDEVVDTQARRFYIISPEVDGQFGDIWYTDDAGATWENILDPGGTMVTASALHPLPDGRLLVAYSGRVAGFACTPDRGRNWSAC